MHDWFHYNPSHRRPRLFSPELEQEFEEKFGHRWFSRPTTIDGHPVEFTKSERPYGYSDFVIWRKYGLGKSTGHAEYSDRLQQWDPKKYQDAWAKHLTGYGWSGGPERVEAFLREYYSDPNLELLAIQEGCNLASQYPFWVLNFNSTLPGSNA